MYLGENPKIHGSKLGTSDLGRDLLVLIEKNILALCPALHY